MELMHIPLTELKIAKTNVRHGVKKADYKDLIPSIKERGIIQPVVVRSIAGAKDAYEIIAGERRWRAAQRAQLHHVPVILKEFDDRTALEIALIENIQREDLNPLEEAHGVKRLLDEFNLTHEQAATAIGRSRSATSNLLRLLNLANPVQTMLLAGDIDMGHARALLGVDAATQIQMANQIIAKRLSVRETEKMVSRAEKENEATSTNTKIKPTVKRDLTRMEETLSDQLGTKVSLKVGSKDKGQLLIDFHGWEHFSSLLEKMNLQAPQE